MSSNFGCFISEICTDEGDEFKLLESQIISDKETLVRGNHLVICSQVCKDYGVDFCTRNSFLKNKCKCYGQFFYACSQDILESNKQR